MKLLLVLLVVGWAGTLGAQNENVLGLDCQPAPAGSPGEYTLTWILPAGVTFSEIRVFEDNFLVAVLPGNATGFATIYSGTFADSCATAPTIGLDPVVVSSDLPFVCVQSVHVGGATSGFQCCVPFPPTLPNTDGLDLAGFCDPGPAADDQIHHDLWLCFVAPASGPMIASIIGPDGYRFAIYDDCSCPAAPANVITCAESAVPLTGSPPEATFDAVAGNSYLVRVGALGPGLGYLGLIYIRYDVPIPENVTCDTTVAGQVTVSWTIPAGANYDGGINLYRGNNLVTTLPGTATSFTEILAAPIQGAENFCVEGVSTNLGISDRSCCAVVNPPANDACFDQLPIQLGFAMYDTAAATTDGSDLSPFCDPGGIPGGQIFNDMWYCFTAPSSGHLSLDAFAYNVGRFAIYDGCACPDNPALVLDCVESVGSFERLEFPVTAGADYLLRIGSNDPAIRASGTLNLEYFAPPVVGLVCSAGATGQVSASWTLPGGVPYDGGINVYANGSLTGVLPGTATSYIHPTGVGVVGPLDICVEGVDLFAGPSARECCSTVAPNDDCSTALTVGLGVTPFDIGFASPSSVPISACGPLFADLWFRFVPAATQGHAISLCGSSFDSILAVYESTGLCPPPPLTEIACDDNACGLQSEVVVNLVAGTEYLIQVASLPGLLGVVGLLEISDCAGVSSLVCDFDCSSGVADLSWSLSGSYTGLDVFANGVAVATGLPGTTTSFVDPNPPMGVTTYAVAASCAAGGTFSVQCMVNTTPAPSSANDLILDLEFPGAVDSAAALEAALLANGRTVATISEQSFESYVCFAGLADSATNIWVMTGSFPGMYALTLDQSNLLASYAEQGKGIYFEGSSQWGTGVFDGGLEDRDGINEFQVQQGNPFADEIDGQFAPIAGVDLSGNQNVSRAADQPFGDFTDELVLDPGYADPGIASTEALWRNSDNQGSEPDFIATVVAVHVDGGIMISSSIEFGGIGDRMLREQLVAEYLGAYGIPPVVDALQRGDCNDDGSMNIADVVFLLGSLFPQGTPSPITCADACDGNDDGSINIGDPITILGALFGTPSVPLPAPSIGCGLDFTSDALDCAVFDGC